MGDKPVLTYDQALNRTFQVKSKRTCF